MIDNSIIKIIKSDIKSQKKFYKTLKKIYNISTKNKNQVYMGIDFEFNTKKVALMQILFEIKKPESTIKRYFIIYPPNLDREIYDYFKIYIMANSKILKILHGSESLDIPYLVEVFFDFDLSLTIDFFLSMVDTRYLCEYLNLERSEPNICKIYDLLEKTKIIDPLEKANLELNEEKMGHIYEIIIDINTITPELITYSIHDVVYLVDLFIHLKTEIIKSNPKNYYLLIDVQRYCFMEKRGVTNIGDDLVIINQMNNYFYYINKNTESNKYIIDKIILTQSEEISMNLGYFHKINLIKTHELILKDFIESYDNLKNIISINYIKTNIINLFRTLTYSIILKYYRIKSSNVTVIDYDLESNIKNIFSSLEILDLNHLLDLTMKFYDYANIKLKPQ